MDWRELVRGTLINPEPQVVMGKIYFYRSLGNPNYGHTSGAFLRPDLITDDRVRFYIGRNPLDIENTVEFPIEYVLASIAEGLLVITDEGGG